MTAPVQPTRSLFDPCKETQHQYTPAASTNLAELFARIRAEQAKEVKTLNVKPIRRSSK